MDPEIVFHRIISDLEMILKRVHDVTQYSLEVLNNSKPDTFLGRKTREPFGAEEGDQVIIEALGWP